MLINGKELAKEILNEASQKIVSQKKLGHKFRMVGVLVGDNPSAKKFLELKKSAAEKVGIEFKIREFPENVTTRDLRKEIVDIGKAELNTGIIVELPLPPHINTQYILNAIPEDKDVDVLSQKSQGAFFAGRSKILPPSVEVTKIIFDKYNIEPKGKNCVVFGYGLLVGKPVSHWLAAQGATVSTVNEFTSNPKSFALNADIIVSGVGKPNLITADMVKDGVVVIDFGQDVDLESVSAKASLVTPPTGGVGPLVIATVMKNLIKLKVK